MEDWIRSTFEVVKDGWAEGQDAFAFLSAGRRVEAPVEVFVAWFGEAPTPPTRAALKACDPGDEHGWHRHFDAWVEQGIITQ